MKTTGLWLVVLVFPFGTASLAFAQAPAVAHNRSEIKKWS